MNLSRKNIRLVSTEVQMPSDEIFNLPEKIIQFGTGVLLRALPDYFVEEANRKSIFNGRILLVKSTSTGGADFFHEQDCLYTLAIRGVNSGKKIDQPYVCSSVSRILSASGEWDEVLAAASNPDLQIVISNTTEVGVQLVRESIFQNPPTTFPAKLLAFLFERFRVFQGASSAGMVIIPTELISENGRVLQSIMLDLAAYNEMDAGFIRWLKSDNLFCNSLVDRIVPGKPDSATQLALETQWGYSDQLMTVCEPYRLWAIEGDDQLKKILSFHEADPGVIVTQDIRKYKELKLRMLNATHTLSCGLAFLSGFQSVREAMDDKLFGEFVKKLMLAEIATSIPYSIDESEIREFGLNVLDRFRNPYIFHQWLSITMQYSSKMAMRVLPVLERYYEINQRPPTLISIGFAAFILFTRPVNTETGRYYGILNNQEYLINDDRAGSFFELWEERSIETIVGKVLSDESLWGTDLSQLEGFADAISNHLKGFVSHGTLQEIARNI